MVICLFNEKGGCAKTTTGFNLAAALAELGYSVLVVDLDRQQSLCKHARNTAQNGLVVCHKTVRGFAGVLPNAYDFTVVDCGPTLGAASAAALKVAHLAIAPTPPRYLDLAGLAELLKTVRVAQEANTRLQFRALVTMATHQKAHEQFAASLRAALPGQVFDVVIPRLKAVEDSAAAGVPVLKHAPNSPAALAYRNLATEVLSLG